MRLKYAHLANYAEFGQGQKATVVGIFDFFQMAPQMAEGAPILLPLFYLIIAIGATSFEAGKHPLVLRVVNEDGIEGGRWEIPDIPFTIVEIGKELGATIIHPVVGMQVPAYGDYVIEMISGNQRLGQLEFGVMERQLAPL